MTTLTSDVFNIAKTDYTDIKPIFNQQSGLFDTVNKKHPEMWSLYKTLKNLDWDENDLDKIEAVVIADSFEQLELESKS